MTDELYEKLNAPRRTKRKIAITKAKMGHLRTMMLPGGIRYDKDKVQTSPSDPMLAYAEKLNKLESHLKELEKRYLKEYETVETLIKGLKEDKYIGVLTLKYLAEYSPQKIATELNYAESYVYKLTKEAIKILEKG